MSFVLAGFSHDLGCRVFQFDSIDEGRLSARYTVRADLTLVRRYGIQIQELPLLCRRLLESRDAGDHLRSVTLGEDEMRICADQRALRDQAAKKRKPWQKAAAEVPVPSE